MTNKENQFHQEYYQGKRKEQYEYSLRGYIIAVIAIALLILAELIFDFI